MRQIPALTRKGGRGFAISLIALPLLGLLTLTLITSNFTNKQLTDYAKSNPTITSATLAWPRLISEPNDLTAFNAKLSGWDVKSNFLIFRQMRDKSGVKYNLIADKNYRSYIASSSITSPQRCDQISCQVIAVSKNGNQDLMPALAGFEIIDQQRMVKDLPIPADFGLDKDVVLLITPFVAELGDWQPFRYLPATYGWQITPSDITTLSSSNYQLR
ncbi:MAG: hypothetical protein ACR2IO_02520, partial [Candidatus Nanopelagicus sp.]